MIGAIAGDIIGSPYERNNIKRKEFPLFSSLCRFTDDTVLTVAVADSILSGSDYTLKLKEYYSDYPHAGYGGYFHRWASSSSSSPYNSWGNGSAMRVSPHKAGGIPGRGQRYNRLHNRGYCPGVLPEGSPGNRIEGI